MPPCIDAKRDQTSIESALLLGPDSVEWEMPGARVRGSTRHTHHGRHLDCGGKSDATPLWVGTAFGRTTSPPGRKRRRRCALPAQSITASSNRLATMVRVKSCTLRWVEDCAPLGRGRRSAPSLPNFDTSIVECRSDKVFVS